MGLNCYCGGRLTSSWYKDDEGIPYEVLSHTYAEDDEECDTPTLESRHPADDPHHLTSDRVGFSVFY
jgi:hypothetical protein